DQHSCQERDLEMDLKGLFDSLYDKLILRDIFGKVVPGSALVLSIVGSLFGLQAIDRIVGKMTLALWIMVVGFAWLIGFALQYWGEKAGMLWTHPRGSDGSETRA